MGVRHIRPPTDRDLAIIHAREAGRTYAEIEREFGISPGHGHERYSRAIDHWQDWANRVHFRPGGFIAKMDRPKGTIYRVHDGEERRRHATTPHRHSHR